jgi:outer membrane protein TolC
MRPAPRRRAAPLLLLLPALHLAGCARLFEPQSRLDLTIDPERLEAIDQVDLAPLSRSAPVTVEEAARNALEVVEDIVAPAPPATMSLSIEEVRAAALAHNLDLRVVVLDPQIAATVLDEEEARFEATFTAAARFSSFDSPTAVATEGSQVKTDTFDLGLNIPLRTGGAIGIALPFSTTETNNPFSLLDPSYDADLRFSISQPLLRNAGPGPAQHSIRVAQGEQQVATALSKLEAIRILAGADREYWNLYAAEQEVSVREQEYELALDQLRRAERRVQAGEIAEIEVVRAQSGLAETLAGIIQAQNALRLRQRNLKRIMNRPDLPLDSPTSLAVTTAPQPMWLDLDPAALAEHALANRMEMLELELRLAIDASTIEFQKNQRLPSFVLDYSYSFSGLGGSSDAAFDQLGSGNFQSWVLGLSGEVPLGNRAAEARVQRAVLARLQRLATRQQRRSAIRQEVLDALDVLKQAWQRILASRLEVIAATRTYEAEQRQFDVGMRTSTDVLDAATRLADARSREVRALADHQLAQVDLAFATGTLLGRNRVRWADAAAAPPESPAAGPGR